MTRDASKPDPLPELLDSLEETLSVLREELDHEAETPRENGEWWSNRRRRRPPRPPRMREILRFTDEYTIPTLLAVLEANVRLLKLAQAGIRVVDPERSIQRDAPGESTLGDELRRVAGDAGRTSADRLASSLSELQRALTETDTPESPEVRELLTDARALSTEIERRIRESREQTDLSRYGGDPDRRWSRTDANAASADDAPVRIEVQDESDSGKGGEDDGTDGDDPDVDVDAELESIKREMGDEGDEDEADATADTTDSSDYDDADVDGQ